MDQFLTVRSGHEISKRSGRGAIARAATDWAPSLRTKLSAYQALRARQALGFPDLYIVALDAHLIGCLLYTSDAADE